MTPKAGKDCFRNLEIVSSHYFGIRRSFSHPNFTFKFQTCDFIKQNGHFLPQNPYFQYNFANNYLLGINSTDLDSWENVDMICAPFYLQEINIRQDIPEIAIFGGKSYSHFLFSKKINNFSKFLISPKLFFLTNMDSIIPH